MGARRLGTGQRPHLPMTLSGRLRRHEAMAETAFWTDSYGLSEDALSRISIQYHYM